MWLISFGLNLPFVFLVQPQLLCGEFTALFLMLCWSFIKCFGNGLVWIRSSSCFNSGAGGLSHTMTIRHRHIMEISHTQK